MIIAFGFISIMILVAMKVLLVLEIVDRKYESIMFLLPIVLLTNIVASITQMYSNYLVYFEKLYLILLIGAPIALVGVALNFNLVPVLNFYGAALSALMVNSCFLFAYMYLARHFSEKNRTINPPN